MTSNFLCAFSFFTGAGFLDLGFEDAGIKVAFANEFNPRFAYGYSHALKSMGRGLPEYGLHVASLEEFLVGKKLQQLKDLISKKRKDGQQVGFIGGPPCPDFSVGGKNRGATGDRGRLTATYFELIAQLKPDWFAFENVKGLFRTRLHREFFEQMRTSIRESGYATAERLINSIEYGAPQDRDRIIMIGRRKVGKRETSELAVDWEAQTSFRRDILGNTAWPTTNPLGLDSAKPLSLPEELMVDFWFRKNDVVNHPNAIHRFAPRAGLAKFQSIDEGDDSKKSYKRLHRFRFSPTACYGNNEVHLHPTEPRRISAAEALAIQSLPPSFQLPSDMTLSDMFKTIGNGVPYVAAKGLALTINKIFSEK